MDTEQKIHRSFSANLFHLLKDFVQSRPTSRTQHRWQLMRNHLEERNGARRDKGHSHYG